MVNNKIASIVPKAHLELIKDDDYFMALSYLCDDPDYVRFYQDRVKEGKYVILDNSTIELGEPESFETYLEKVIEMDASCLVLPDHFPDKDKTLISMDEALIAVSFTNYGGDLMGVPQGKTTVEWLECSRIMSETSVISVLGVSYRYNAMSPRKVLAAGAMIGYNGTIHLLGCQGNPYREVAHVLRQSYVQGVDSSFPAHITKLGRRMSRSSVRDPNVHVDDKSDVLDAKLLERNLDTWRRLCNGVSVESAGA